MERLICPDVFDVEFARQLIKYLGGDIKKIIKNDCWNSLFEKFPELREKAENYFEEVEEGNPAYAAFRMVRDCGSDQKWADKVKDEFDEYTKNSRFNKK